MQKALFFDLDHSLIRPLGGRTFPTSSDDWEFVPGILEAIRPFMEDDFMFVIISNQGGIEAGYHTALEIENKLEGVLIALDRELGLGQSKRLALFYCPSLKEDYDRKPNPGMVLKAIEKFDIDAQSSYSVGDMETDYQAFSAAGVRHYYHVDHFLACKPKPEIHLYQ